MHNKRQTGTTGEELASGFLKKQGYGITEKNYRTKFGEIDIIAVHRKTVVFVEVKMRTSDLFGTPGEAVNTAKLNKIRKVASYYLEKKKIKSPVTV